MQLFDSAHRRERAVIHLARPGGSSDAPVGLRFQDGRLLVFDAWGRLLVVSLEDGELLGDVRVS